MNPELEEFTENYPFSKPLLSLPLYIIRSAFYELLEVLLSNGVPSDEVNHIIRLIRDGGNEDPITTNENPSIHPCGKSECILLKKGAIPMLDKIGKGLEDLKLKSCICSGCPLLYVFENRNNNNK